MESTSPDKMPVTTSELILFADDEPQYRSFFEQALVIAGRHSLAMNWDVRFFKSGKGVASVGSSTHITPSVCILDWNFDNEGESGLDVADKIQKAHVYTPILFVTNFETPDGAEERNKEIMTQQSNFYFLSKSKAFRLNDAGVPNIVAKLTEVLAAPGRRWSY